MSYDDSGNSTIRCMCLPLESLDRGLQVLKTEAVKRPIRGDKLFVQVVNGLAREIVGAGSERIIFPAEPELCRMLGVSRTVLREAVTPGTSPARSPGSWLLLASSQRCSPV